MEGPIPRNKELWEKGDSPVSPRHAGDGEALVGELGTPKDSRCWIWVAGDGTTQCRRLSSGRSLGVDIAATLSGCNARAQARYDELTVQEATHRTE